MAKKIKKYQGGGPVDEYGNPISPEEASKRDKALTKSISGYKGYRSPYDIQKEESEKLKKQTKQKSREEMLRALTPTPSKAASTYVKKPAVPKIKMAKGGSFPDLTGDGKVTRADILKGRGVFKSGGSVKPKMKMGGSCGTPKRLGRGK